MDGMSAAEIRSLLKVCNDRANNATEGPWAAHDFGYSGQDEPSSIVVHRGEFDWQAICDGEFVASMPTWDRQESDDAEFISHARTDVPALTTALLRIMYVDELDPALDDTSDPFYQEGVINTLRHIHGIISEELGDREQ